MRIKKRLFSFFTTFVMLFAIVSVMPKIDVEATQDRSYNFNKSYTLTGNGADDIVNVAKAQIGKTGSQLGYTEEWCADFVSDCAKLANQSAAIPSAGYCPTLQENIGGSPIPIGSAQKGDIAFYGSGGADHVEIIYANNNGRISTIGGNSGSGGSLYARMVRDHSTQSQTITKVLRPNYSSGYHDPEGCLDSAEGGHGTVTFTGWALDRDVPNDPIEIHIYMDGKAGEGGVCVATGIMADQPSPDVASIIGVGGNHRFSATFSLNVTGQHSFYAYAINAGGGNHNPELYDNGRITNILEKSNGIISNVYISQMTPSGYTVNVSVDDELNIGRIAVPVWTETNGQSDPEAQDDLLPSWEWESLAKKTGTNTYAFYVNTKDHNSESGRYCNDVYAYDKSGNRIDRWCIETDHRTYADVPADRVITDVSPAMITHSGYKLYINVANDSKIDKIAVPVWTTNVAVDVGAYEPGQDDLLVGWEGRSVAKKTATNLYEFDVSILDHNSEHGEYNNDIYAYDKDGNMIDRWCLETNRRTYVDVPAEEVIEDVIIENVTPFGYDVVVKVADESVIKNVAVPVWSVKFGQSDSEAQDDLIPGWQSQCFAKKISTNTYSYHVNVSDHKDESGEYCNDVYVYNNDGNLIDRWCVETGHRTYAYVPENIIGDINADGKLTVSDIVIMQKYLVKSISISSIHFSAADVNSDGQVNVFDVVILKRKILKG